MNVVPTTNQLVQNQLQTLHSFYQSVGEVDNALMVETTLNSKEVSFMVLLEWMQDYERWLLIQEKLLTGLMKAKDKLNLKLKEQNLKLKQNLLIMEANEQRLSSENKELSLSLLLSDRDRKRIEHFKNHDKLKSALETTSYGSKWSKGCTEVHHTLVMQAPPEVY